RARNTVLADALGACPRCWGEDVRCVRCRGRGRPGGRRPDRLLFTEIVEPAIQRATARPASAGPPVPASETRNEAGRPRRGGAWGEKGSPMSVTVDEAYDEAYDEGYDEGYDESSDEAFQPIRLRPFRPVPMPPRPPDRPVTQAQLQMAVSRLDAAIGRNSAG